MGEDFWRCHRGFLVNRNRIQTVDLKHQTVLLDNGEECPLSRRANRESTPSKNKAQNKNVTIRETKRAGCVKNNQ